MEAKKMRLRFFAALALAGWLLGACSQETEPAAVHIIRTDGTVGPIMEQFIDRALDRAEDSNALLAVIELDTPGGLSSSMRQIVQRIEAADVPVAVYVSPIGGRAASAGTFITMAGHIAAMAPNTSIGAASAINSDGSDIDSTLAKKVENDAVAFIRGIAELRGRNADWAELAVREAAAVNQSQAVELNVVDFVANDVDDLLRQSEGRTFELRPGISATLSGLETAPRVTTEMTVWEQFLGVLADPTIASLLISLGFIAILIEMGNPGLIVPGVSGAIAVTLGFLGFGVLPVDTVGLVLIVFGLGLIAVELFVPGGILGIAGLIAFVLGGIIAFRDTPADLRPDWWLLGIVGGIVAAAFGALSLAVARVRRMSSTTGTEGLVGQFAVARTTLAPDGFVFVHGERWRATIDGGPSATAGETLRITGAEGLRLKVRKEDTK
ncbi:MAG: nodulation protein NfeD [Dehalococcoidia bacterium]